MAITIIVTPGKAEFRAILDGYLEHPDPDNPRPEYLTLMRWLLGEATEDELLREFPDWTRALRPKARAATPGGDATIRGGG